MPLQRRKYLSRDTKDLKKWIIFQAPVTESAKSLRKEFAWSKFAYRFEHVTSCPWHVHSRISLLCSLPSTPGISPPTFPIKLCSSCKARGPKEINTSKILCCCFFSFNLSKICFPELTEASLWWSQILSQVIHILPFLQGHFLKIYFVTLIELCFPFLHVPCKFVLGSTLLEKTDTSLRLYGLILYRERTSLEQKNTITELKIHWQDSEQIWSSRRKNQQTWRQVLWNDPVRGKQCMNKRILSRYSLPGITPCISEQSKGLIHYWDWCITLRATLIVRASQAKSIQQTLFQVKPKYSLKYKMLKYRIQNRNSFIKPPW